MISAPPPFVGSALQSYFLAVPSVSRNFPVQFGSWTELAGDHQSPPLVLRNDCFHPPVEPVSLSLHAFGRQTGVRHLKRLRRLRDRSVGCEENSTFSAFKLKAGLALPKSVRK